MNSKVSILLALYLLAVLFCLTFAPIKLSYNHYFNSSTEVVMSIERNYRNYSCDVPWVTFVVPFRDREQHLPLFLEAINHHQKHQMKSNVSQFKTKILGNLTLFSFQFNILIVEQEDKGRFNRAKLMNIGAKFAFSQMNQRCAKSKSEDHLCLIFHDIDMLPLNSNLKYNCLSGPVGLASAAQQFKYKLPYLWYFGGVVAISWRHFVLVNGYSNNYWGWGGEDDDFLTRIRVKKLRWGHIKPELGRFRVSFLISVIK